MFIHARALIQILKWIPIVYLKFFLASARPSLVWIRSVFGPRNWWQLDQRGQSRRHPLIFQVESVSKQVHLLFEIGIAPATRISQSNTY